MDLLSGLLSFIDSCLEPSNEHHIPRDDYKEFLELSKIVLGEEIHRKRGCGYRIQRPGADHHARWMSKAIYTLKLILLVPQFPIMSYSRRKQIEKMAFFIIFVYLQSWFTASFLYSSASADLDLYKRINRFSKVDKKVADVAKSVLQRHTWYLTEELIPLSLLDSNLRAETRNKLADRISKLPECEMKIQKPGLPKIRLGVCIPDFVRPRLCVLFKTIGVSYSFLALQNWKEQPEYYHYKGCNKKFDTAK